MRVIDISLTVTPTMPVWPGDPSVVLERVMALEAGDIANVSHLSCSVHTGTHVDAPNHFVAGAAGVDELPMDSLIGPADVYYLPKRDQISAADLDAVDPAPASGRMLLRTRNSELWNRRSGEFEPDYVALTAEAARWIADHDIQLIGVDYLSVQLFHDSEPTTHRTLLSAGVVIVEGLNLNGVQPGRYQLVCLPLKLAGCDGAPARVVLVDD